MLFTDFGLEGPYTGQVQAVLHQAAPEVPVISLFADLPPGQVEQRCGGVPQRVGARSLVARRVIRKGGVVAVRVDDLDHRRA